MLNKNLKISTLVVIIIIFLLPFNKALGQTPGITVPVSDYGSRLLLQNIGGLLDTLNTQLVKLLTSLNVNTQRILESTTNEKLDKYLNDSLKFYELTRYVQLYENQLKSLKEETETYKKNQLEEAKIAGAYLALRDVVSKIKCTDPTTRNQFNAAVAQIFKPYDLSNRAVIGYFNNIEDCKQESSSKGQQLVIDNSSNKKIWTVFLEPFSLKSFLAQIAGTPDVSNPNVINISSQFDETESFTNLTNMIDTVSSIVAQRVEEKVEEREKEIGTIKPYYEKCVSKLNLDTVTDQGKVFCTEYQTYISGDDFQRMVNDLKRQITNPQISSDQTSDYLMNLMKFNEASTTLIVSSSSDAFLSKTLKEKICGRFDKDKATIGQYSAYAQCLKDLAEKDKEYTEKTKNEIKRLKDLQETARLRTEKLENRIKRIRLPGGCTAGNEYLSETWNYLETEKTNYRTIALRLSDLLNIIDRYLFNITQVIYTMNQIIQEINYYINIFVTTLNELLTLAKIPLHLTPIVLDNPLLQIPQFLLSLFKINFLLTPESLQRIVSIIDRISYLIDNIDNIFNQHIANITNFQKTLNENYRYDILSANNRLINDYQFLENKLGIYEELAKQNPETLRKRGICLDKFYPFTSHNISENQSSQLTAMTPTDQKFNFLSYIENLFKPKIVKIIYNEKY